MEIFDLITASVKERKKFLNFKLSDLKTDMRIHYLKVFEIGWMNTRKRFHYQAEYNFSKIGLLYNEGEGRDVYKKVLPFILMVILMSFVVNQVTGSEDAFGYTFLAGAFIGLMYFVRMAFIQSQVSFRSTCGDLAYELAYDVNKHMKEGMSRVDAMQYTYKRLLSGVFFRLYPYKQERHYYLNAVDLMARIYFGFLRIQQLKGTMSDEELYRVASKMEKAIFKDHMNAFELTSVEQKIIDDHKQLFLNTHVEVATEFYETHGKIFEDRHYKPRFKKSLLEVLKLKSA